jgi:hypothetical protein
MWPSKSNKKKKLNENLFFVGILSGTVTVLTKEAGSGSESGSGSLSQWYGSVDPDPYRTKISRIHIIGFGYKVSDS